MEKAFYGAMEFFIFHYTVPEPFPFLFLWRTRYLSSYSALITPLFFYLVFFYTVLVPSWYHCFFLFPLHQACTLARWRDGKMEGDGPWDSCLGEFILGYPPSEWPAAKGGGIGFGSEGASIS
ncbi:hypothetical protein LZ32DRAFT_207189 [Colletotrichum eremochloae]|nr:hypothetical protein LZ32DRAFT_207189 [Colletotrichum eremochloae]